MRYVSSIPPAPTSPDTRQVGGLTAIHAVKAVAAVEQTVPNVVPGAPHQQEAAPLFVLPRHRESPTTDRRKVCRRVSHQTVLVELRSGLERRHHNQRAGDIVEHVDEEA